MRTVDVDYVMGEIAAIVWTDKVESLPDVDLNKVAVENSLFCKEIVFYIDSRRVAILDFENCLISVRKMPPPAMPLCYLGSLV